jgi:hypothetical protein
MDPPAPTFPGSSSEFLKSDLTAAQAMADLSCNVDSNVVKQLVCQPSKKETTDPDDQKPPAQNNPSGRLAKGRCIDLSSKKKKRTYSTSNLPTVSDSCCLYSFSLSIHLTSSATQTQTTATYPCRSQVLYEKLQPHKLPHGLHLQMQL